MAYTFKKLRLKVDESGYGNCLNDILLLLLNMGFTEPEAEEYVFDKWLQVIPKRNKLYGNSSVDFLLTQLRKEI